jgi:hypothetical protein
MPSSQVVEERFDASGVIAVRDSSIAFQAQIEIPPCVSQPRQERVTSEFAVHQHQYSSAMQTRGELFQQRGDFERVAGTGFAQVRADQGKSEAVVDDGDDE